MNKIDSNVKLFYIILAFIAVCDVRMIFKTGPEPASISSGAMLADVDMYNMFDISNTVSMKAPTVAYFTAKNKHKPTKISSAGIELIKQYEQCKLKAYRIKGEKYNTIGWGHVIRPGDKTPNKISQAHADKLLEQDLQWVNEAACRLISKLNKDVVMSQGFFDGLCSMIYNCGERGVETSLFYKRLQNSRFHGNKINSDDLRYSIAAVKQSRISQPGHVPRRYDEHKMMLN